MSNDPIDDYLRKLRRSRWMRRADNRLQVEVEDHLRTAARALETDRGLAADAAMREAVARFGKPSHLRVLRLARPRLIVTISLAIAILMFLAGLVTWNMTAPAVMAPCSVNVLCFQSYSGGQHLHPLRAEMFWAVGALALVISAFIRLRERHARSLEQVVS